MHIAYELQARLQPAQESCGPDAQDQTIVCFDLCRDDVDGLMLVIVF
jgi:hypothetical protein